MRKTGQNGFSLIQLMIVLILVSVVSTAIWNLRLHRMESSYDGYSGDTSDNSVEIALEDIKYHIGLAGYEMENRKKPLKVVKGKDSDKLIVWHNEVCFEFYVDQSDNLVKRIEKTEKVIAENVSALNVTSLNGNRIAVSISTVTTREDDNDKVETLSKSFSTTVETRNLL